MAMTLQEISGLLNEVDIRHQVKEDKKYIVSVWSCDKYKDHAGNKSLGVIVRLEEDGEFIKAFVPSLYKYKEGPNLPFVLEACMYVSWRTKMIQFEYDPSDGEIRAMVEFPIEDGKVTAKQLRRILGGFPYIVDEYDEMIRTAIEQGKFAPKKEDDDGIRELLSTMGELGPEGLKELMEEIKRRKQGGDGARPTEL